MTTIRQLFELQEVDSALDRLRESLRQVEAGIGESEALLAARAEVEARRKSLADLERRQRLEELEVRDLKAKMAELERKLYSGSIRNPKELASLQADVEMYKKRCREREDIILDIMILVEAAREELEEKLRALGQIEKEWRENQDRLELEQKRLREEIQAFEGKRAVLASSLGSDDLKLYEGLRGQKQGRAVALVERGMCQGCRVTLPMSDLQRARSAQGFAFCSNCGRILYLA